MPSLSSPGGDCPKHPQERLKYYCQLHDELVCADCLAMEQRHQGHVHTRADDLADDYRRSLHSQLQPLQDLNDKAQTALKTMSSRRKEISANGDSVKQGIKHNFNLPCYYHISASNKYASQRPHTQFTYCAAIREVFANIYV